MNEAALPAPCEIKPLALKRWNPGIRAASEEEHSISIYDVIGQDPWSGEGVTTKRIAAALRSVNGADVTVNINSPGGDMFEGLPSTTCCAITAARSRSRCWGWLPRRLRSLPWREMKFASPEPVF